MMYSMRDDILDMVDEMLDMDGDVKIGNLSFSKSQIVKELDPTAYRMMVNDIIDSRIEELEYEIQCMDEDLDADEIADIHVMIAELQEFTF